MSLHQCFSLSPKASDSNHVESDSVVDLREKLMFSVSKGSLSVCRKSLQKLTNSLSPRNASTTPIQTSVRCRLQSNVMIITYCIILSSILMLSNKSVCSFLNRSKILLRDSKFALIKILQNLSFSIFTLIKSHVNFSRVN